MHRRLPWALALSPKSLSLARGASVGLVIAGTACALVLIGAGCEGSKSEGARPEERTQEPEEPKKSQAIPATTPATTEPNGASSVLEPSMASGAASSAGAPANARLNATCPTGMVHVRGAPFWAGRETPGGNDEEHPRHLSRVHDFCVDRTEVTTAAYEACVAEGKCESAKRATFTCNSGRERGTHPINCVSWDQAQAYCKGRDARLPSELEWEYAARGGPEYRTYSFGNDSPDGHTCWKQPKSCEVAKHTEGAFGLHDMSGNVWEWTSTWYGPYPWPSQDGYAKVYRGGGWSRRFEKWLSLTLRNRQAPREFGSHLGFRCAALLPNAECPYGRDGDECRFGIDDAECPPGETWNGVRCAAPGITGCAQGESLLPGHGCVGPKSGLSSSQRSASDEDQTPVTLRRDPHFDADCAQYQPTRPKALRFEGGSHAARTAKGKAMGCKNRDVGVGWNSSCCP